MKVTTPKDRMKDGLYNILSNYVLLKSKIRDKLKGKPDVLIIGEDHINPYHAEIEARIIGDFKPKYVLLEQSYNAYNEEAERRLRDILRNSRTLKDFSKTSGVPLDIILDVFEKTRPYIKEIEKRVREKLRNKTLYIETMNIIPTTPKELLETPFYRIPSEFWELYSKIAEEEMLKLYNKLSEGGTKKLLADWQNTPLQHYRLLRGITFGYHLANHLLEIKDIYRGVYTYKLIVMDSAIRTGAKIGYFDANEEIKHNSSLDYKAMKERERIMGLNIVKYLKESGGPIVVITGRYHTRKDSELLKVLEEHGIKYRVIRLPTLPFTYNRLDPLMYGLGVLLFHENYQTEKNQEKVSI